MNLAFWRKPASSSTRVNMIRAVMATGSKKSDLPSTFAQAALAARDLLGLEMHDVQLQGALSLADGRLAEMQTGEGKTLAAVPAAAWLARQHGHVHVLTVNDYLAKRDAEWMGPIYQRLGLTVGHVTQASTPAERRRAYAANITYVTANECGFDLLRDGLALHPEDVVHQPFAAAILDEADSILIDEARIPLVIAGATGLADAAHPERADALVRHFQRWHHFTIDEYGRNLSLTDHGIHAVERWFAIDNPFAPEQEELLAAVMDALHAHVFLHRDVDYLVRDGAIESIDEFKGRIAENRRWPAGLHTAVEVKEGVARKQQGSVLASLTLEHLVLHYHHLCGMTGTASTQAAELRELYGLEVDVIPTHQPMIRADLRDRVFRTRIAKEDAVLEEIVATHATGRPVLIGTASVEESERLSQRLSLPHQVLNARNDAHEAALIAKAGEQGAITISTNMAGRGTDIRLGEGVAALGGLHVIGTNRHEARRIDDQLRGRAGRQGDPGSSQFFVSLEDPICVRYDTADPARAQRIAEGQNLAIRQFLRRYEGVIERHRRSWQEERREILHAEDMPESERMATLSVMDDRWSNYLAAVTELRHGIHWVSWGGREPLHEYLTTVAELHAQLDAGIEEEIEQRRTEPRDRGATWTYQTTDQPFGTLTERVMKGLVRKWQKGQVWG